MIFIICIESIHNTRANYILYNFKPFGLRGHIQCPHKPPSRCNTHVIIQICVLINHIYQFHTHAHAHTHTHTHTHTHSAGGECLEVTCCVNHLCSSVYLHHPHPELSSALTILIIVTRTVYMCVFAMVHTYLIFHVCVCVCVYRGRAALYVRGSDQKEPFIFSMMANTVSVLVARVNPNLCN